MSTCLPRKLCSVSPAPLNGMSRAVTAGRRERCAPCRDDPGRRAPSLPYVYLSGFFLSSAMRPLPSLAGKFRMHADDVRRARHLDDRNVVGRRVRHLHRVRRHGDRSEPDGGDASGRRAATHHLRDADRAARAGHVHDDDRFAQQRLGFAARARGSNRRCRRPARSERSPSVPRRRLRRAETSASAARDDDAQRFHGDRDSSVSRARCAMRAARRSRTAGRRVDEDDAPRCLVGNPIDEPVDALRDSVIASS